jgi:hypothetical protein
VDLYLIWRLYPKGLPEFCPTADHETACEGEEGHSEISQALATAKKCISWKKCGVDSKSAGT